MTAAERAASTPQRQAVFTVLVVVGTDHHRFDRLVDWLDAWAERQQAPTRVVFQHGSARSPTFGEGHVLMPHAALQELMHVASVVVSHAGPATICEAWRSGRLPVVVPRDPALGEHVDGHQQQFAERLARQGLIVLCREREQLGAALDEARRDPARVVFSSGDRGRLVAASVAMFGQVVDDLLAEGRRVPGGGRRWPVLRGRGASPSSWWTRGARPRP